MNKSFYLFFFLIIFNVQPQDHGIIKHVLSNGFTILIKPTESTQRVAVQLWVPVGSKHETMQEKGIAHLIEHMIFKGSKNLSETDYQLTVDRLSGNCNAATSFDTTRYYFNVPAACWDEVLPLMVECLIHCSFKQDLLNAEFKAVIQELKMYRDNYALELSQKMFRTIFCDHPYHFPIIGFKHHVWNITSQDLHQFYKKHYVIQNAVLVVVGNVNPEDVIKRAEEYFGSIAPDMHYKKQTFDHVGENFGENITLYRPISSPIALLAWSIPGFAQKPHRFDISALNIALTFGANSRLYKLLVDEKKLVQSIMSASYDLYDADLFLIRFYPYQEEKIDEINQLIKQELNTIKEYGLRSEEITRIKSVIAHHMQDLEENHQELASVIAESYLATGDPCTILNDIMDDEKTINDQVQKFIKNYLQYFHMHQARILPLPQTELVDWKAAQEESDAQDSKMLSQKIRQTEIEPPLLDHTVKPVNYKNDYFITPQTTTLENGLELLWYHRTSTKKISLILDLKADYQYDSQELPGIYKLLIYLMQEGSQKYPKEMLSTLLQNSGMHMSMYPGKIMMTLHASDIEKACDILRDIVMNPLLPHDKLDFMKQRALYDLKNFWDDEHAIAHQLALEHIFAQQPKSKNQHGTYTSIENITHEDIVKFYKRYVSPREAKLAIVGNLEDIDVVQLMKKYFGDWQGIHIEDIKFPEKKDIASQTISYAMNRDQIQLLFVGPSIDINHADYFKLLLFDYIFSHGMNSRLFKLREREGIFYTIQGSLMHMADEKSSMVHIAALVSKDRLQEAKNMIIDCIQTAADSITQQEVIAACNMAYFDLLDQFSHNTGIAQSCIYAAQRSKLDYYKHRSSILAQITPQEIKDAVKKILDPEKLSIIQVGRI